MSKNYYFHLVILFSCLFTGLYTHAQVKFKVELLTDNTTYQVSMLPETAYAGTRSITNSAQVTLAFPTGAFEVDNFQAITGSWNSPTQYVNPIPSLNRDYLIILMPNSLTGQAYVVGQSIPLFTFENKGTCPGGIELMDNTSDPFFKNNLNISAGNQITILGYTSDTGQSNAFAGASGAGSAVCDNGQTATCDLAITSVFTINETICGANDGKIQISTTGGTAPLEYSIDNGATWGTSFSVNNVAPSSYTIKARNATDGSCEVAYSANPVIIAPYEVNILLVTELPSCVDSTNGSINIGTDSNAAALEYSIDNGATYQTTPTFANLGNGTYMIKVKESSTNCEFISDNNPISFNITTACANTTTPTTNNCIMEYILEDSSGILIVSMLSNVSYSATESIVASTQLTLRVPTGQLAIENIFNYTNAAFALTGQQVNPATHPGFDFYSFSISNLGATLPFTAGATAKLFSFNNSINCASGAIQLIGTGDGLNITEVNGANVASQLSVSGFGSADAPICVNADATMLINHCNADTDGDGVKDIDEDLNGDGNIDNDDTDGDGIPNYKDDDDDNDNINTIIEEGAPNGGDGNGDGIPDCIQVTVASNIDLQGTYRTLETGLGNPVIVHSVVTESAQAESDEGYDYPHFLDAFLAQTTGTIDVNILYHNITDFSNLTYRKYGPISPTATAKEWYDFPHTFSTKTVGGQTVGVVSFQLKDNEKGDSDPTVGRISDPGGLAAVVTPSAPATCDIEYILTENNGVYEVSMLSNVSYSTFESLIGSMQVTVRSTAGLIAIDNTSITDPYNDVSFVLSPVLSPSETPGFDYFSFNAVVAPGTTEIAFNAGQTVPLFSFTSLGTCNPTAADSLYLVGDGASFVTPDLASNNIASQLSTAGGGIDQPVCVNNKGIKVVCEADTNTPPTENCEVQYILTETNGLYTISMYSDITWTQFESTISTMQITLRAPTGTLQVDDIVENYAGTNFSITSPIINPIETTGYDYFSFTLSPFGTNIIPFNAGETVELFNFKNIGTCSSTDSLYLVGAGAPFPIPIITTNNLESQLFTGGGGGFDTPVCVSTKGVAVSCHSDGDNTIGNGCEIQYILEENNGLYEVKMYSDITWSVIERIISSMQITVRAPTGTLALNNDCIEETYAGTVFELASTIINPSETPGFDYFSFNLTSFGSNVIPFTAGETVSLFTFKNLGDCTGLGELYLVGDGGAFPVPNIPEHNLPSQLFAAGGGGFDSPVCVDASPVSIACTPEEECQITYILEDSADVHIVKMFSNVSWNAFERTISTMQVTMRAPTGIVTINNNDIVEYFAGTIFDVTSPVISPAETPAYDYFSFTVSPLGTTAIPFVAGDTVNLFHFKNSGECFDTDSLYLVGNGAHFPIPIIANNNVESQLSTAGGGVDVPICVSRIGGSIGCFNNTPPPCVTFSTNATSSNPTGCNQDNGQILINTSPSNNAIYSINGGGTWSTSNMFSGLSAGQYTVEVALADTTCNMVWGQVTLTEPVAPTVTNVNLTQAVSCGGTGSIAITASIVDGIIYSIDGGTTWTNTNQFTDLEAGNYTISVALADTTCVAVWGQETLTEPAPPAITSVNLTQPVTCEGTGSIQILSSPASGLLYSVDGGTTWSNNNLFTDFGSGNYVVAIAQADTTCISIGGQETLSGPSSPIILNELPVNPSGCGTNDGLIQIATIPSTGLLYSINGGATWSTSNVFPSLSNGTYELAVANADESCITSGSMLVLTSPAAPIITNVVPTDPTSCESENGQIQITANSTLPIIYSIDGGTIWSTEGVFTGLSAGFYTVNIAHSDTSCVVVGTSLTLTNPAAPTFTGSIPTHPTNCSGTNGSIMVNAIPNNLIYSIDGGLTWATNPFFQNLSAGSYILAIANSDTTCMVTGNTVVLNTVPSQIVATINPTDPSGPNTMDGCIEVITTCADNLEYSLNGVDWQASNIFCNLGNGIFSVRIRCMDGTCSEEPAPIELNSNANSCATIVTPIPNTTLCDASSISLVLGIDAAIASQTITGGTTSNIVLTNNDSTLTFDAQLNGVINFFTVNITTTTGCELVEDFVLYQAQNTEADFVVIEPYCKEAEVTIQFTGNATPNASLNWSVNGGTISNSSPATPTAPAGSEITVQWDTEGSKLISLNVNDNGCTDDHVESIFIRKLPLVTVAADTAICPGDCVPLNGDGTAVWYTWSPAEGLSDADIPNPIACPETTTTYILTAMSADGCITTKTVTVTVDEIAISVSANETICEGGNVQLMATGGTIYNWSPTTGLSDPSIATPIATPTTTTTYMVTVTNATGCSEASAVTITVTPNPSLLISNDVEICQGEMAQLTVNTHNQYEWSPATGLSSTTIANPIANPTSTTPYTVVVTDIDGCTSTGNVTVTVKAPDVSITTLHDTICNGYFTQLTATGGLSYNWSPATGLSDVSIANPTAMPLVSTDYCVTVTDADGCTNTDCIRLEVDNVNCAPCVINAGPDVTVCGTTGTQLTASGSFTYVWSPTTGLSNPNIANPIATPSQTTTYTVTGTSADGFCISTDEITVTVEPIPRIITYKEKFLCRGDSVYLLVNAHASYAWNPTNTMLYSSSEAPLVFPTSTTIYTVTVTSENGCTNTENITVNVSDPNNSAVSAGSDGSICGGESIQLQATGGSAYTWSPATGLSNPNIANPIASPTITTQYCVTTGGGHGDCSSTDCVTIIVDNNCTPPPPCQVNGGANQTICPGASTQLNATGASTYVWSPSTGLSNPNIANPTAAPSVSTLYTVTGTNSDGCVSSAVVNVFVGGTVPIAVACEDKTICQGESIRLVVNTNFAYAWSQTAPAISTGFIEDANTGAPTVSPSETTTYRVTVTNVAGCTATDEVIIYVNGGASGSANAGSDETICENASVQLNATGGDTYTWSPATGLSNANIANPVAAPTTSATYCVTIVDINGCTSTDCMVVTVEDCTGAPPTTCQVNGGTNETICDDESVQLNATGALTYTWSPSAGLSNSQIANPIASPATTTVYTVTGRTANGCVSSAILTVNVENCNTPPSCQVNGGTNETICDEESVQLNATGALTYNWSPSAGLSNSQIANPIASPTATTVYTVTGRTANGCVSSAILTVNVENCNTPPSLCQVNAGANQTICQGTSAQLNATGALTYNWSPSTGLSNSQIANPIASPTASTTYTVTGRTADGCVSSAIVIVYITTANPIANAGNDAPICSGGSTPLFASGGVSYEWSPIAGLDNPSIQNPTASPTGVTTYTVTVTDASGCTDTDEVRVMVSLPITTSITTTDASCCGQGGGSIFINASGGFGNLTYSWSSAGLSGHTASNLNSGGYTVTITDAQGCSNIENITIGRNCDTCAPIFSEETTCIELGTETAEICLPIVGEQLNDYIITVDGVTANTAHGCDFENVISYSYSLIPSLNTTSFFRVEEWELNGVMYATDVMTISDLTNWMNEIDPDGKWVLNATAFSLTGGVPTNTYGLMKLVNQADWNEALLQPNLTGRANGVLISVDMRDGKDHLIRVEHPSTCCVDELIVSFCTGGQPCLDDMIAADELELTINDCDATAIFCIEIPFSEIDNYTITDNGLPYENDLVSCAFGDTGSGTLLNVSEGYHELIFENGANGCQDRLLVNVNCPANVVLDTMIMIGEEGVLCLEDVVDITSIVSATQTCLLGGSEIVSIEQLSEFCWKYTALSVGMDRFCIEICTSDGICKNVIQVINVIEPEPATCPDFLAAASLSASLTDCTEKAAFCINLPFDSIRQYGMMLDGAPFREAMEPCEEGTLIRIGLGLHTLQLTHLVSACVDSIIIKVDCPTDIIEVAETVEVNEMGIYCPESTTLLGPITSIENICPEESGELVLFELVPEEACITYTGFEMGAEIACIVICDDNNICDTIYLTVHVVDSEPRFPIAMSDVDSTEENTPITLEIINNDSINGSLRIIEMVSYPLRGEALMNVDNSITYMPEENYCELDNPEQFLYRLCNQDGCDTATIMIRIPCPDFDIKTGFSPNGDGVNDVFYIQGLQRFPNNELSVYNRWGNLVFNQKGYANQWVGTFEEDILPDATYFYVLDLGDGSKPLSGFVQISK